jgi:hypothetical protein
MTPAVATKPDYTPEYLLAMPDGDSFELVDGQWLERSMVRRAGGTLRRLHEDDALAGEDVVPGFRRRVQEIVPSREPAEGLQPALTGPNGLQKPYLIPARRCATEV